MPLFRMKLCKLLDEGNVQLEMNVEAPSAEIAEVIAKKMVSHVMRNFPSGHMLWIGGQTSPHTSLQGLLEGGLLEPGQQLSLWQGAALGGNVSGGYILPASMVQAMEEYTQAIQDVYDPDAVLVK